MKANDQPILAPDHQAGGAPPAVNVLLVEDDPAVAAAVRQFLVAHGLQVAWAASGAEAKRLQQSGRPDVVLVDIGLPDTSGISLIRWLVQQGGCGIIVLSGLGDEADRTLSLDLGADDYVLKPPVPRELVARILAVHRRVAGSGASRASAPAAAAERPLTIGDITIDLAAGLVADAQGKPIDLTAAEFAVLEQLMRARGLAVSRDDLSRHVLRRPWRVEDRSIDQLVFLLRHKLAKGGDGQRLIQTVRGAGYRARLARVDDLQNITKSD